MESYIISIIVKFLLQQGVEYLGGDLAQIKRDCERYIKDEIGPWWLERIALEVFDGVWDLILGEIKDHLETEGKTQGLTLHEIDSGKHRSLITQNLLEAYGRVA